jgi:dihydrofolate reductase
MGRIIISSNATLDGVVQDPDGQEGFERGGWVHRYASARDFEDWVANETEEVLAAAALLLGRRSFEWFASRAPEMAERVSRPWADRMHRLPKYVVSSTLAQPGWSHATLIDRDPVAAVAALKRTLDGDLLVYGSYQLARALVAHNLVDELRLVLFPVVLGTGLRLFDAMPDGASLGRGGSRTLGDGLMHCTYTFARAA